MRWHAYIIVNQESSSFVNIPFRYHNEVIDQVRSLRNRSDNINVQDQRVLLKLLISFLIVLIM